MQSTRLARGVMLMAPLLLAAGFGGAAAHAFPQSSAAVTQSVPAPVRPAGHLGDAQRMRGVEPAREMLSDSAGATVHVRPAGAVLGGLDAPVAMRRGGDHGGAAAPGADASVGRRPAGRM